MGFRFSMTRARLLITTCGSLAVAAAAAAVTWGQTAPAHAGTEPTAPALPMSNEPAADEAGGNKHLKTSLISDKSSVEPGESFVLGVRLDVAPGWHTYWPGLNDTGVAPIFHNLAPSKNLSLKPVEYPAPTRYLSVGLLDHVYEGSATLLIPATVSSTAKPGDRVTLEIDLEFLVCKDTCIPGRSTLKIELPVAEKSVADIKGIETIKAAQARLGRVLPAGVTTIWSSPTKLTITAKGSAFLAFYPAEISRGPTDLIAQGENSRGGSLELTFDPVKPGADKAAGRVTGLLEVRRSRQASADSQAPGLKTQPKIVSEFYTVDVAPPDASLPAKTSVDGGGGGGGNTSATGGVGP